LYIIANFNLPHEENKFKNSQLHSNLDEQEIWQYLIKKYPYHEELYIPQGFTSKGFYYLSRKNPGNCVICKRKHYSVGAFLFALERIHLGKNPPCKQDYLVDQVVGPLTTSENDENLWLVQILRQTKGPSFLRQKSMAFLKGHDNWTFLFPSVFPCLSLRF